MELSIICVLSEKRKKKAERFRKYWAQEAWLVKQLWKHVPPEVRQQILIDYQINETDPDFCFHKAAFGEAPTPIL